MDVDEDFDSDVVALCEQVRRCGRLDTDEAYASRSDDGWRAFQNRHGTYGFDWSWEKHAEAERAARVREQAFQARLAERQREAQIAAKLQADQDWWDSRHPPPKPKPKPWNGFTYVEWREPAPLPVENVEPWFDPQHVPTNDDLQQIQLYAANYFAAAMREPTYGWDLSMATSTIFECARTADAIAGMLYPIARAIAGSGHLAAVRVALKGEQSVLLNVRSRPRL